MTAPQSRGAWLPRDPLVQLMLVGAVLFGADHLTVGSRDETHIEVDEAGLINFLQYRNRAFDAARFRARLDNLSSEELSSLVNEYVEEEALVRKARSMHLDRNDYVARRRLVSQLEYLLDADASSAGAKVTMQDVQRYYAKHRDELRRPTLYDFRHVFLAPSSNVDRTEVLKNLQAGENWEKLGDRFAYEREWHRADPARIAGTFGNDFNDKLEKVKLGVWQGPIASQWGDHYVYIESRIPGAPLTLPQAEARIRETIAQERERFRKQQDVRSLIADYQITYADTIARKMGKD